MFAGNFAPAGWEFCDGRLLPISQYESLFQLIGTTYGGDGQETFALPDLRGRIPVHQGNNHVLGESAGSEDVTLTTQQIPTHTHPIVASATRATRRNPKNATFGTTKDPLYVPTGVPASQMDVAAAYGAGGSQPHTNMQPYLCVNFIIAVYGVYPSPT
jgi:microcystin-dependent protein